MGGFGPDTGPRDRQAVMIAATSWPDVAVVGTLAGFWAFVVVVGTRR